MMNHKIIAARLRKIASKLTGEELVIRADGWGWLSSSNSSLQFTNHLSSALKMNSKKEAEDALKVVLSKGIDARIVPASEEPEMLPYIV